MKRAIFLLFLLASLILLSSGAAFAAPFEDTVRILEDRTAFHWGRDCFVWVVHYSEALVDPWVEAEAGRLGMSASERDAYRTSFISDLSMGQSEALLVTVHAFGARPLDLSPFSGKIALVTPDGERVKPEQYARILDQPLSGVVQGLVFFPKQNAPDFAVAIAGLGVFDERIFAFGGEEPASFSAVPQEDDEPEVIVVELPPAPVPRPQPLRAQPPKPQAVPPQVTVSPALPPEIPPPEAAPAAPQEPEIVVLEPEADTNEQDVAYSSREQTLRTFLDLWMKSDIGAMYSMLSEASREKLSRQDFDAELRKSADFKNAIRDGYTIDWAGTDMGKVIVVRRFLFIRTLITKTFGVTREDSVWKIVW